MKRLLLLSLVGLTACIAEQPASTKKSLSYQEPPQVPSGRSSAKALESLTSPEILIQNARIMTATDQGTTKGDILLRDGKIIQVGEQLKATASAQTIDAAGKYVTPGIIDTHSHIGVYPMPGVKAHSDGNEAIRAQTADVWAEHSFWPQDPGLWRALVSGVTTIQVLPGSANLIGGRGVTLHTVPETAVEAMKFPGAPQGLKMACGENPKRVYGDKGGPATRMGNYAGYRKYFQEAFEYGEAWRRYERDLAHWQNEDKTEDPPTAPKRNHAYDTLVAAMNGEVMVHIHCYRADEMSLMLDLARDFNFKVRSFHHALEGYKIAPRLAAEGVSISTWADWWGFKMEAFDGIPYNAAMSHAKGVKAIIHSDSAEDIRFLNLEAAKALTAGRSLGLEMTADDAIKWITQYPAWALGIDQYVGTIEEGKIADLVLWDDHPFSAYAKTEKVFIKGQMVFDRVTEKAPQSDFETGIRNYGLADRGSQDEARVGPGIPTIEASPGLNPAILPQNSFVLVGATVFDGEQLIADTSVWVENGRIKKVGASIEAGPQVPRVEATGKIVTPGLIEVQSQLGTVLVEMESQAKDHTAHEDMSPGFHVIDGFDPYSIRIPIAREHGISSAIVKPVGGMISGQGFSVDLRSSMASIEDSQSYLFAQINHRNGNRGTFWLKIREAFEDAELYSQQMSFLKMRPMSTHLSLSPIHLEALVRVMKAEMPLVLEAHRLSDILGALRFRKEMHDKGYKIELILAGAEESWLASKQLAEAQVPVIITPTQQMPRTLNQLRVRDDLATLLQEAGVPFVISTNDMNVRRLRQQAGRAVAYGLPYENALKSITADAARYFKLDDRGSLSAGLRADLVVWSGDPLEPQSYVEALWIAGQLQEPGHRQRQLARSYLDAPVSH